MKKLLLSVLCMSSATVYAEAPAVLQAALDAYVEDGAESFLPVLLKGSALEGEKSVLSQANAMSQIEAFYGKPASWEVLATCNITDRIRTTYYIVHYQNGPAFGSLDTYVRADGNEVVTKFQFHTESALILPQADMTSREHCRG
jgi:hypothetical protein